MKPSRFLMAFLLLQSGSRVCQSTAALPGGNQSGTLIPVNNDVQLIQQTIDFRK